MCIEYLKNSWKLYSKNPIPFIIGALAIALVSGIGSAIASFLFFGSPFALISENMFSLPSGQNLWAGAFVFIITAFAVSILQLGMYGMAMESLKKKTSLVTMEKTFMYGWLNVIIAGVLSMVIVFFASLPILFMLASTVDGIYFILGIFLSAIVLFFVIIHLSLIFPAIVSKKSPIEAIKSSIAAVRSNYIGITSILLSFGILSFVIGLVPIVGDLISLAVISPCSYIALCEFYQKAKKR